VADVGDEGRHGRPAELGFAHRVERQPGEESDAEVVVPGHDETVRVAIGEAGDRVCPEVIDFEEADEVGVAVPEVRDDAVHVPVRGEEVERDDRDAARQSGIRSGRGAGRAGAPRPRHGQPVGGEWPGIERQRRDEGEQGPPATDDERCDESGRRDAQPVPAEVAGEFGDPVPAAAPPRHRDAEQHGCQQVEPAATAVGGLPGTGRGGGHRWVRDGVHGM